MCIQKLIYGRKFRNIISVVGLLLVVLAVSCNLFWKKLLKLVVEKVGMNVESVSILDLLLVVQLIRAFIFNLVLREKFLEILEKFYNSKKFELELSSSSKSFSLWVENPMPFYIDFYFFNWTNPNDLKGFGYKPKFNEVGPFRFREEIKKTEIIFNENKTVSYKKLRRWFFESNGSRGSLSDVITSINVIALTAARRTRSWNKIARLPLSVTLSSTQEIAITKTVKELLFDGFSVPLIDLASKIPALSSEIPFDRFGWFYKRNDSSDFDGVFNVETGANGLNVLGEIKFWNFNNRTPFYEGPCGKVKGSAGDFWPPPNSHDKKITLFSPDMCRYIDFIYKKEESVKDIKGFRYDSGLELFDNGTIDPTNKCFCNGKCYPSGVVNVSSCRFGAPAFVSYPHFHLADSFYLASIDGLKPDSQKHDMYIILEKEWGIPLEVAIRLQINILIESDSGIRIFDGLPIIYFPMIWFEQKVTITEHLSQQIQLLLALPKFGSVISIVFYTFGFSCIVVSLLSSWVKNRRE